MPFDRTRSNWQNSCFQDKIRQNSCFQDKPWPAKLLVALGWGSLAPAQRFAEVGRREAGSYGVSWDGRDERGAEFASGIYLYRLRAGAQTQTRKLLLLR